MLGNLMDKLFGFSRRPRAEAHALYGVLADRARDPVFYNYGGVGDSLDGRFDLLILHVFLVMHRFKGEGEGAARLSQEIFDLLFADMDRGLRVLGVSDVRVGRRVKEMVKAFYGRVEAYDQALGGGGQEALGAALERNLYRGHPPAGPALSFLVADVLACVQTLAGQDLKELVAGRLRLPDPAGARPDPE